VSNGGPAAAAGIRPGDVVTAIEGEDIASPEDLLAALRQRDPGDRVSVDVQRGGETRSFDVTLTDRPSP
jgi:serine protease DegQ